MKKIFLTITAVLLCALTVATQAEAHYRHEIAAGLRSRLASAHTPQDSIKILYDILDVLPYSEQPPIALVMDSIATRIGDNTTRLDLARLMTSCYNDDKNLGRIENKVAGMPESQEQKETRLFLKMKRLSVANRHKSEEERQKEIIRILAEDDSKKAKTPTDQLLDLFSLVEYLRNDASGDMLKEYLDRLSVLASSPHFKLYTLPNFVQSEAARIYTDAGDAEKAVAADRKVLQNIEGLEKKYAAKGRRYRNYDIPLFNCYLRMISNHEALRPGEVAQFDAKVRELAGKNIDVKNALEQNPDYRAYYAMATRDYATAIPLLKQMLAGNHPISVRKHLLEHLAEAAEKTGDDETQMEALSEYTELLEELNKLKTAERYRELQIKYDVQDLKTRNAQLELENRNDEIMSARRIMTFVIVAFVLILVILILSLYHWGSFKRNASKMGNVVDNIHSERGQFTDALFENDDTDPLAAEERMESETWSRRLRARGAKWDNISLYMTRSIINDLLYISCIGHNDMARHIEESSVSDMLRSAEASVAEVTGEHARIVVDYPKEDIVISTDRECLTALIENIFDLSIQYSPEDTVTISCRKSDNYIDLVITTMGARSAGPGDPQLFDDFSTAKMLLRRKGAGMFICRMISMLLQCRFIPDSTYTEGCRYVFRIPSRLNKGVK